MLPVETPFKTYTGLDGKPLDGGSIYFGQPGLNPITAPVTVYWDAAGTQPAFQPLRTVNGYIVNKAGAPANVFFNGSYSELVQDKHGRQVFYARTSDDFSIATTVLNFITNLAAAAGSSLIGFIPAGFNAVARFIQDKLREIPSVGDWGTAGDGVVDDTNDIKNAIADLPQRGLLTFAPGTAYKITDTILVQGKAGSVLNGGNQQINAASFSSIAKSALKFNGMSEARIGNIYVIGSTTYTSEGVYFSADATNITIQAVVDKIRVASCVTGVLVGSPTYQMSDSQFVDTYASDCATGFKQTGENTLAMLYGRLAAYNCTSIGVHLEQGGASITSLQSGGNATDVYFGQTDGTNHVKLARVDILSGYSEEGSNGERFIDSAACTDTNPFHEEVYFGGFRATPFTSTNQTEVVRWRMNGDLFLRGTITHGQQLPVIAVDHNTAYYAPEVNFRGVIDCNPVSAGPQLPLSYTLTDPRQRVTINARVNDGLDFWQNGGASDYGRIQRGIYMEKLERFENALLSIGNLMGAWNLRDLPSGQCQNLVLGAPNLTLSATMERRDFWQNDGLIGFYRNASTSKTLSTSSSVYAAQAQYTFCAILRLAVANVDEVDGTALGGASGIRIGMNASGGNFASIRVGALNVYASTYTDGSAISAYDPHAFAGRYTSGTSMYVDGINLRTGQIFSASYVNAAVPAYGTLTWTNGVSLRNDNAARGFPAVYGRALTDIEVSALLQMATRLTDSWRRV